jgi:hypothetical protein
MMIKNDSNGNPVKKWRYMVNSAALPLFPIFSSLNISHLSQHSRKKTWSYHFTEAVDPFKPGDLAFYRQVLQRKVNIPQSFETSEEPRQQRNR